MVSWRQILHGRDIRELQGDGRPVPVSEEDRVRIGLPDEAFVFPSRRRDDHDVLSEQVLEEPHPAHRRLRENHPGRSSSCAARGAMSTPSLRPFPPPMLTVRSSTTRVSGGAEAGGQSRDGPPPAPPRTARAFLRMSSMRTRYVPTPRRYHETGISPRRRATYRSRDSRRPSSGNRVSYDALLRTAWGV